MVVSILQKSNNPFRWFKLKTVSLSVFFVKKATKQSKLSERNTKNKIIWDLMIF
ncbi:MAG: hypothetical protein RIS29_292 [Bacteroidota bacterium]|jgi:hypothetical protein